MLVEARQQLETWITAALGDVSCSAAPPGAADESQVLLYLMSLTPRTRTRATRQPESIPFGLRYLVVTQGEQAEERLGLLMDAALREDTFEVDLTPLSPEAWLAFGAPPQPSFLIDLELAVTRERPKAPPVLHGLSLDLGSSVPLHGQVLGPQGIPLPGARVEVLGQGIVAYADGHGAFDFPSVPDTPTTRLRVSARGREFLTVADRSDSAEPIVITCNVLED